MLVLLLILLTRKNGKHIRNINKSKKIIKKINQFEFDGQKLNYLKKIDPFVFEELLLSSYEKKGYKIKRNKKYTGDGGIDGIIYKNNKEVYIQAKRYKGHINLQHLKDFQNLINRQGVDGIFIHTGKTGKASKEFGANYKLSIVSGSKLLKLIEQ